MPKPKFKLLSEQMSEQMSEQNSNAPAALCVPAGVPTRGRTLMSMDLFPRARAALLALCMAFALPGPVAQSQVRLPALGDGADNELTVGAERRFGEQIMREVRRDPAYLDDPVLLDYVQALWTPLVKAARLRGDIDAELDAQYPFEAFLVQDRSVNAFALPGGFVGVHLGLIALTATRSELAAVLAHELTHISQRHIARSMAQSGRQSMLGMAAMILGVLAASRSGNPDIAQAAVAGGQAAILQGQLNFSRDMEREADRVGFGVMSDAGYAAAGMANLFDKMDQSSRLNDAGAYPYLRSHPLSVERMAEARARTALAPASAAADDGLHGLMQMRAKVLMDANAQAWRRHVEAVRGASGAQRTPALLYGAALASSLLKDHAAASALALELASQLAPTAGAAAAAQPNTQRPVQWLLAEIQLAQLQPGPALALAATPGAALPRPALLLYGQAVVMQAQQVRPAQPAQQASQASQQPGVAPSAALLEADQALRAWLAGHRSDAAAWQLLAATAQAQGHTLREQRAQAEVRAAQGDVSAAIARLREAQRLHQRTPGSDFVEASIIDARLRELQVQWREWVAQARKDGSDRSDRDPP